MVDFIDSFNFKSANSFSVDKFSEDKNSEKISKLSCLLGGRRYIKLGPNIRSCLNQISKSIEDLAGRIFAFLSSSTKGIINFSMKLYHFFVRKEARDSADSHLNIEKTSIFALNTLGIENRDCIEERKKLEDEGGQQLPLDTRSMAALQRAAPSDRDGFGALAPDGERHEGDPSVVGEESGNQGELLEDEDDDDNFDYFDCQDYPPVHQVFSDGVPPSSRIILDDPDDSDGDEGFYDSLEYPPGMSMPGMSMYDPSCHPTEENPPDGAIRITSSLFPLGDAEDQQESVIELNTQNATDKQDLAINLDCDTSIIPKFSEKLFALLNLILKTPIDSLNIESEASKIEKIDENITQYTFNLPTKKKFDKRIPKSILSKIPGLDYKNLSFFYQSLTVCGSKFVTIHNPINLSFALSLDKKKETATLMFLNPSDTLSVGLDFGLFGNFGTAHVHQIRYDEKKSSDSNCTVYFKDSSGNWPKTLSPVSSQEDDLWSALNELKYDLSTKTISEIWSILMS